MRKIAVWALFLCGGVGAQEEEAAPPLDQQVRLSKGRPRYRIGRSYALPDGVVAAAKPGTRKGTLEKRLFFFFDVDGNGKFDDLGVDGWALNKMPAILPLEETTVIGASAVTWQVAADGTAVRFRRAPLPLNEGQRKILIQFNQWRFMNGLPAVTIDRELSDACNRHCEYMEKHGLTHEEKEGQEGYTPEGAEAGRRSCLAEDGPVNSVHMFYASFYHRLPLIHPGTKAIGVGASRRYSAVDGLSLRDERPWIYPVIVPAPNSFGHPTHFSPEAPSPLPPQVKWGGFPITLTFDGGVITKVKAELRLKSAKGKPVPILVSWPGHPANPKRPDNRDTICIIPRLPLAPLRTWWVQVRYELDGEAKEHVWRFNTGRPGPAPIVAAQRATR